MNQESRSRLPIGYWLKHADNLLTEHIHGAHAARGVSRFEWQVLNLLREGEATSREHIFATMRTFVSAAELDAILNRFTARGWVEDDAPPGREGLSLTPNGRRQHESILAAQRVVRERAMQGITQEEYATAVRVLQRIAANLESDDESAN